jgi:hypothetical protein
MNPISATKRRKDRRGIVFQNLAVLSISNTPVPPHPTIESGMLCYSLTGNKKHIAQRYCNWTPGNPPATLLVFATTMLAV